MNGGKIIQMRKFHFLEGKKYQNKVFIADKPKVAGTLAYQFLKIHYKLGNKKFDFEIIDKDLGKKYKYSGETLNNGKINVRSL